MTHFTSNYYYTLKIACVCCIFACSYSLSHPFSFTIITHGGWTRDLWNIGYPSLITPTPLKSQKIIFNKRALGWNLLQPKGDHPPILEPVLKLALPSCPIDSNSLLLPSLTFYWPSIPPPPRASKFYHCTSSAISRYLKLATVKSQSSNSNNKKATDDGLILLYNYSKVVWLPGPQ